MTTKKSRPVQRRTASPLPINPSKTLPRTRRLVASPRPTSWGINGDDLIAKTFPAKRWAVPGLVAEGLTLLVGAPKVCKSWLALGLAVAVATGGKALGSVEVDEGDVLYLALEDSEARLKDRLEKVRAASGSVSRITFATTCKPIPAGGAEQITEWLYEHPDARLVVIDVLARIRGVARNGATLYETDYSAASEIKKIADDYKVAILAVHHTRKAGAEDFVNQVSGTNGLAGAADTIAVLKRHRGAADGVLHITGRDVEEVELALGWDIDCFSWRTLSGAPSDYAMEETRRNIISYIRKNVSAGPKKVAEAVGITEVNAKQTLRRMVQDNQLDQTGRGTYCVPVPLSLQSPLSPSESDSSSYKVTVEESQKSVSTLKGDRSDRGDTPTPRKKIRLRKKISLGKSERSERELDETADTRSVSESPSNEPGTPFQLQIVGD